MRMISFPMKTYFPTEIFHSGGWNLLANREGINRIICVLFRPAFKAVLSRVSPDFTTHLVLTPPCTPGFLP